MIEENFSIVNGLWALASIITPAAIFIGFLVFVDWLDGYLSQYTGNRDSGSGLMLCLFFLGVLTLIFLVGATEDG